MTWQPAPTLVRRTVLLLAGATALCVLLIAGSSHEPVHGGVLEPCEIITVSEAAAVLESPLNGDPQSTEFVGFLSCRWEGAIEHGYPENKNEMVLTWFSGPEDEADLYFDNTYAPIQEEVAGVGDRAKWVAYTEQFPDFVWHELRVRFQQYYLVLQISKYADHALKYRLDSSSEMVQTMLLVLSRLQPRAPVEFTQAIQVLQENFELKSYLDLFGQPPVPIIAGKPAVARVYHDSVQEFEVRTVHLSGVASAEAVMHAIPDCTVEKQRRQEDGCESADLYFTPPEGEWTATITIRDEDGAQLDEMEFTIESVRADPLNIQSIPICDEQVDVTWQCGSAATFASLLPFLRATFPGEIRVTAGAQQVQQAVSATNPASDWWDVAVDDVLALWTGAGSPDDTYYYGVARGEAGTGTDAESTGGIAYQPGHAGASRTEALRASMPGGQLDTSAEVVAHEIGHNIGRPHVPSPAASGCYNQPPDLDPGWPNGNSPFIEEVGFDVANQRPVMEEDHADWMTYCTPRWISAYTYNALVDAFRTGAAAGATTSSVPGNYWLVTGSIEGLTASFAPLFEVETTSDGGAGSGGYRIEVKGAGGATLSTRLFTPVHAHSEDITFPESFAELVPVEPAAQAIMIFAPNNTLLGTLIREGEVPSVEVAVETSLTADAPGFVGVDVGVTDADSAEHTAWVEFSSDAGVTWETILVGVEPGQLTIGAGMLPGTQQGMVRVRVSDGINTGVGVSEIFSLPDKTPQAGITFPGDTEAFGSGTLVWLQGFAMDAEDGNLDGDIAWTSSLDGALGSGASLPVYDLSEGTHIITLNVRDSDDNMATDTVTVIVGEASGEEVIWGDDNCSGDADPIDSLLTLRFDAGLSTNTGECPGMGEVVEVAGASPHPWGDVDCGGDVNPVDSLKLLRFDAGLDVAQADGCPELGTIVTVSG